MAKIWYSVQGEGMGHAIRSSAIIDELKKNHKLFITGFNKSYSFLKKKYGKIVHEIEGNGFVCENNEVNIQKTIFDFMNNYSNKSKKNFEYFFNYTKRFKPDLIISDFEPLSHFFGFFLGVPVISIDNINIIAECEKLKVPAKYKLLYEATRQAIKLYHPRSDYFLITTIIDLKPQKDNVLLFPPILRKAVLKEKSQNGDSILVYQTTDTNKELLPILKALPEKFKIYGMNVAKKDENITFKKFSEKGFINDMRKSKAVIVNGGFTTISEALFFKKPILAVPLGNQFEQVFNGISIKKLGYGDWYEKLDKNKIEKFIKKIPDYNKNLVKLETWDNSDLVRELEEIIFELQDTPKPVLELTHKISKTFAKKNIERTLTIIKPDAVEKGLIGEVISRLEEVNVKPVAMKMRKLSKLEVRFFYDHVKGKVSDSVFKSIIDYMTSKRVVLIVWQGHGVVKKVRSLCGPTDPQKAKKTELRSLSDDDMKKKLRYGKVVKNIIHSSGNTNEAEKEINFYFRPWEINKL